MTQQKHQQYSLTRIQENVCQKWKHGEFSMISFQPDISLLFTKANRREGANENTLLNSWEREVFLKPFIRPLTVTLTRVNHSDPIWSIWVDWDSPKKIHQGIFTKGSGFCWLVWPKLVGMTIDLWMHNLMASYRVCL